MSKKFKDRKIFKVLTNPVIKGGIKVIPFVGSLLGGILDEVKPSEAGTINKGMLTDRVIEMVITAIIIGVLIYTGNFTEENAEMVKSTMGK